MMMKSERAEAVDKARKALAETLRKVRAEVVAHTEGDNPPRIVCDTVEDLVDVIDAQVASLIGDRDSEIDEAVEDLL
jgi:hypothetical protein